MLPVRPTRYITRCPLSVKLQGNKLWYNAPSGVSGSRRHSAEVASLSFDPKIVSALEKDRTSKLYTRWRPSNKRLHTDQFSSAIVPLKFYLSFSTTSTVGKKDFGRGFDSNSGEEGTDNYQQHPLVPGLVAVDNGYITYESSAGPEYGDGSRHCLARALNKHSTPSLHEEVSQRSDRVWEEGEGGTTWRRGRGRTCSLYWSVPTSVENLTPVI